MQSKKVTKKQARRALEALGPKVSLVGRLHGTRSRYPVAHGENGCILKNVVINKGEQVEFPLCHYELRYTENGKDMRPDVGDDAIAAEEKRAIIAKQLEVKKAADEAGLKTSQDFIVDIPTLRPAVLAG